MPIELSIRQAIDFHNGIGSKRKEDRLRYLQTYWTSKVRDIPGIIVHTPADPARSCGIANVGINKLKPAEMAKTLLDKYSIWTVAIDHANVQGCRITPHVFTTTNELDALVNALREMNG
jgi:selenocysteine lyase/cysteine desulfurase